MSVGPRVLHVLLIQVLQIAITGNESNAIPGCIPQEIVKETNTAIRMNAIVAVHRLPSGESEAQWAGNSKLLETFEADLVGLCL